MPRWLETAIGAAELVERLARIPLWIAAAALLWRACDFYIEKGWL